MTDDEKKKEKVERVVGVQDASDAPQCPTLPSVMNATSNVLPSDILALRADGLNWKLCYYDSINDALIPESLLSSGKTQVLSTLKAFPGLRIVPPILPI